MTLFLTNLQLNPQNITTVVFVSFNLNITTGVILFNFIFKNSDLILETHLF